MKSPSSTRRFLTEVAQGGWIVLVLFFGIAVGQILVGHFYGAGWGVVASFIALAVWLVIRPWRLGFLSQDSRREVFIFGVLAFAGWIFRAALLYWRTGP